MIVEKTIKVAAFERKKISINIAHFWPGATCEHIVDLLLSDLQEFYEFEMSETPSIVLYGPYDGQLPKGTYVRVFIGCENLRPIMSECDWAFGMRSEDTVNHPKYMRIIRWGDDSNLVQVPKNWPAILDSKKKFCAFVYSNPVRYREDFFERFRDTNELMPQVGR